MASLLAGDKIAVFSSIYPYNLPEDHPLRPYIATDEDGIRVTIGTTLDEIERTLILATLQHFEGDKRRAADVLGCSLKTLYNKLHAYRRARHAN